MKSYDVELDSFVNVMLPEDVDVDTPQGKQALHELAIQKIRELFASNDISLTWKRYPEGDTQEEGGAVVEHTPHTPEPWFVNGVSSNDGEGEVIASAGRTICWMADTYDEDEDEGVITPEDKANGRLVVAAPYMLNVLKAVREIVFMMEVEDPICQLANDIGYVVKEMDKAINKAEGKVK